METRTIQPGIHEIPIEHVRAFVLDGGEGVTLVDTGFDRTAADLIDVLEAEFGTVDRLVITHDGPDHHGGADQVIDHFDPELYVAADETAVHEAIEHEPDVTFEHGDVLPGEIEVIQIPGHTPSPSALLLRDEGILISGDTLDGADRRGLPAGYLLPPPALYNHDHAGAEGNLSTLQEYDFDTVLVFHGSHVHDDAKEKLDRYLDFKEHYRQSLLEERD